MVWYRVRVSEYQLHTTTQKYTEYPPKAFLLRSAQRVASVGNLSEGLPLLKKKFVKLIRLQTRVFFCKMSPRTFETSENVTQ